MKLIEMFFLGVGLAMDAGAVSMTNGLIEPKMKKIKIIYIALFFGCFQAIMPIIGYFIGSILSDLITKIIPIISLVILAFLGIKMIIDAIKSKDEEVDIQELSFKVLIVQSIATSIDALSVGLIFVGKKVNVILLASLIIGIVTFIISILCTFIGKKFGNKLGKNAQIIGGAILIIIGLKIFIEFLIEL